MQIPKESLFCLQDETDAPYNEGECPYPRTPTDDEFDRQFIQKWDLELTEELKSDEHCSK